MVYDYVVTLKRGKENFADRVSILMYIFALVVFVYYFRETRYWIYLIVSGGILLTLLLALFKKRKNGEASFRLGLIIAAAGWLLAPQRNIFMSVLYLVAGILEKQAKFPVEIGFSEEKISFNSFPQKTLKWSEVNNVMIKDGLLTIDRKNNRLFQKEIENHSEGAFSFEDTQVEDEFNAFCKRQLGIN